MSKITKISKKKEDLPAFDPEQVKRMTINEEDSERLEKLYDKQTEYEQAFIRAQLQIEEAERQVAKWQGVLATSKKEKTKYMIGIEDSSKQAETALKATILKYLPEVAKKDIPEDKLDEKLEGAIRLGPNVELAKRQVTINPKIELRWDDSVSS